MSEVDNKGADGGNAPDPQDPIKNLKAEFGRKQENIENQLKASQEALQAIMAKLDQQSKPAAATKPTKVSVFDDEEAFAASIKEEVRKEFREEQQVTSQYQTIAGQLYNQYPELNDQGSELFKAAQEKLKGLSPEQMMKQPMLLKTAVLEAAAENGIRPRHKRSQDDDNFSVGAGSAGRRSPSKPKDELDPQVLETARLMGRDVSDPKVVESLKKAAKRTNWGQYK
jgi:hypothetical protein